MKDSETTKKELVEILDKYSPDIPNKQTLVEELDGYCAQFAVIAMIHMAATIMKQTPEERSSSDRMLAEMGADWNDADDWDD